MKNNVSSVYNICLVIGDGLALVAAFVTAYVLRIKLAVGINNGAIPPSNGRIFLNLFLVILPFWIMVFALLGLYNSGIYEKRFKEFGRLLVGSFIGMLGVIFWDYMSSETIFPARLIPIYGFALGFIFLLVIRNLARFIRTGLFGFEIGITRVLLVGNTSMTRELIDWLHDSRHSGYRVVGVVGGKQGLGRHDGIPLYHSFNEFLTTHQGEYLHGIIQTELYAEESRNALILSYAQEHHIGYRFVPGNTELFVGNIEVELFRSSVPVLTVHQTPLFGWGRVVKRITDVILALAALLISSPFMLVIILLELVSRSGSVFFHHTRLTRFDHRFELYKFRSQYKKYDGTTPEEAFAMMGKPELGVQYREQGDYLANDPRVTPLGRFLRATSLDELPQLFNVLRGDISFVGPRALIPQELAAYHKKHAILSVKSGLTGLAQVSGRRNITFEERRSLDLYYVQNWSLWMDITILAKTVRAVLFGNGAK